MLFKISKLKEWIDKPYGKDYLESNNFNLPSIFSDINFNF